jgi:hypothetical protein
MGVGFSINFIIMYTSYAVAFWFGSLLVVWNADFDRGSIFTVFFAIMSGSTALGGALPHLTAMAMAKGKFEFGLVYVFCVLGAAHYVLSGEFVINIIYL